MFFKKCLSDGMVTKPTSRSWDDVDDIQVLVSFCVGKVSLASNNSYWQSLKNPPVTGFNDFIKDK
ncbi:hypothetical protein AVEN_122494-1, partial [Araneus ventricosus]